MTKILLNFESKSLLNSLSERLKYENFATTDLTELADRDKTSQLSDADVAIVDDNTDIATLAIPTIVVSKSPNIDSAVEPQFRPQPADEIFADAQFALADIQQFVVVE